MKQETYSSFDVIIVGAGPAGIFTALELVRSKKGFKILILDKGNNLESRFCPKDYNGCKKCNKCSIISGWGGAGSFSDGKLVISKETGGNLKDYINDEDLDYLLDRVDKYYLNFGAPGKLYGNDKRIEEINKLSSSFGLKMIPSRVRHLGTDNSYNVLNEMYIFLKNKCDIKLNTCVHEIIVEDDKIVGVSVGGGYVYKCKYLVIAPGREGSDWLNKKVSKLGIKTFLNPIDLGVRVEIPDSIGLPITDGVYESKFIYYTKCFNDKVRTFCMCPNGEVISEYSNGVITVNGHSYENSKTDNTNFSILVSKNFTKPFNEPVLYGEHISKLSNMLSGGIIVQRLVDLINGHRSTYDSLKKSSIVPTLKDAVPGDLGLVLPYRYVMNIIEMLKVMDNITPGIYGDNTLLYGVEVKFYSSRVEVDNDLETKIKGLYVAGDGSGITRGLMQSSVSGIIVAKNIIEEYNIVQI